MSTKAPPPRTVLIVDDDRELQHFLTERFEREGWRVIVEKDGDWAIRSFERLHIDGVVLDILLPVVNGFQVAERIRKHRRGKNVGIVMLTGIYRGPRHRAEAIGRYGLIDYLDKPVDAEHLVELFRKHFAEAAGDPPTPEPTPSPARLVDERQRREKREVEKAARARTRGGAPVAKGNLRKEPFPQLLARLYRERVTGGLFLLKDKAKKIVYFRDGHPYFVKSNVLEECLGWVLVKERMITSKECETSVKRMKAEKRQQGSILIEMGVISPHNLRYGLERQLQVKLFDLFSWERGEHVFRDDVPLPESEVSLEMSNAQIIFEGIRRTYNDARLDAAIEPLAARYIAHAESPEMRYQDLSLSAAQRLFVDLLDGTRTVRDVVESASPVVGRRGAQALVYALTLSGVLVTQDEPAKVARKAPAPPPEPLHGDLTDEAQLAAFLAERRGVEPRAVLGISAAGSADDARRAFDVLARQLHPDRFRGRAETTLKMAREAFELVSHAHAQVVAEDTQDDDTAPPVPGFDDVTVPRGSSAEDPASRALAADVVFKRGEERLRARAFAEAESLFRQATDLRPDEGRYRAFLGWAVFCSRGQGVRAADEALPILEEAARLSPQSEHPHLFLGMVYQAISRMDLAEQELEKALACNPDSVEALRELRELHTRRRKGRRPNRPES